jgi:uncharacterized RDD family membrane protein YckC
MDPKVPENVTVVDGYSLANPFERIIALIIDLVIYGALHAVLSAAFSLFGLSWLGILAALCYLLFRDSLRFLNYQSVGKRIMKLKVIKENDKTKISLLGSLKRNFIFLPNLLSVLGWSIYGIGAVTIILAMIEIYLLYTSTDNQRLGDQFANTIVIEKSI